MSVIKTKDELGNWHSIPTIKGDKGDAGQGIAQGGTTGQFLKKKSATDYDTEWGNIPAPAWADVTGKPSTFPPSSHTHDDRYYTEAETNALLGNKANTSDVYTKTESDNKYALITAIADMATKTWVNAQGFITSLAGYATEAWVNAKNYATQSWVEAKGYLTEHQSLSAYRTSADQDVIDGGKEDKSNKVTSFSATPSDDNYPSEKLVKDSLDAKAELPTIVNDRYLHTNASTGNLEWAEGGGGGGNLDLSIVDGKLCVTYEEA